MQYKINTTQRYVLLWITLADTLFAVKYGYRVIPHIGMLCIVVISYILIKVWLFSIYMKTYSFSKALWYFGVFAIMLISLILFKLIAPTTLHVDRWDVVVNWWEALFSNVYPYHVLSRFGGYSSLLPGLQWLLSPFVAMQEVGYATIFALLVCLYFIFHESDRFWFLPYVFLTSTAFWWEVAARSTLICNTLLIIFIAHTAREYIVEKRPLYGFLQGFVLSSRLVFGIIWLSDWLYDLREKPWFTAHNLVWGVMLLIGFSITFVPLFFYAPVNEVLTNNAIFHQNKHMPGYITLSGALVLCVWAFWFAKNRYEVLLGQFIALAFFGILFVLLNIIKHGIYEAIFESRADISYLNMSYVYGVYLFYVHLSPKKIFNQ